MIMGRQKKSYRDPNAQKQEGFDPQRTTDTFTSDTRSPSKTKKKDTSRDTENTGDLDRTLKSTSDGGSVQKDEDNYDITMRLLEQYSQMTKNPKKNDDEKSE